MNKTFSLTDMLSQEDNFIKLYKFSLGLGPKLDVVLCALINAETWVDQGLEDDPDYFHCNVQGFMSNLLMGYSEYDIRSSINKLCDLNLISKRSENINGKNGLFIKLNSQEILKLKQQQETKKKDINNSKKLLQRFPKSGSYHL